MKPLPPIACAVLVALLAGCAPPARPPSALHFAPVRPEARRAPRPGAAPPSPRLVVLTFDDGPSNERFAGLGLDRDGLPHTPSEAILDVLHREHVAAAFFVLTGPDHLLGGHRLEKGETALGLATMRRAVRDGHVLGCHWGGLYEDQFRGHPASVALPAYDADGDGVPDQVTPAGNALESELLACMRRVRRAYTEEGLPPRPVDFVRPPLWRYDDGEHDARPTYAALGLRMVLGDVWLPDGGVAWAVPWFGGLLVDALARQVREGRGDVVVALHDPNRRTAAGLGDVLARLRARLAAAGLREGADWRFARDADEVEDVLARRSW